MDKLKNLSPAAVFCNFEKLSQIPRESGNETAVSEFLYNFGKNLGLKTIREESGNVIITKPASAGYENAKKVILQGHMDMVCVKLDELSFDFEKDPIPLKVEGDYIMTEGTTLGADNGIAVAMIMSILQSDDLSHPEITALITVAEETGMDGVLALDPGNIAGDILINLDSEEEGTALASCAGGVNNIMEFEPSYEKARMTKGYSVLIDGLLGGHSGIEIHKGRANAIKLMGRLLQELNVSCEIELSSIEGGEKMNAIPKRAVAAFNSDSDSVLKIVDEFRSSAQNEYSISDGGIRITLTETEASERVMDEDSLLAITAMIRLIPDGVQTMSMGIEGLVESSNNLGVLENTETGLKFTSAVRSSVRSLKHEINRRMAIIARLSGARNYLVADYPEWEFRAESDIRETMKSVYSDMYGKEFKIDAIHAGLECGFISEKLGDMDMISIGPNLHDVHTPYEKLSISSTERVYEFLLKVLEEIR